jgi:predicted anti-sigma-YlaC factor YlaD
MSAKPFLTCREIIDFIVDYLDHSLDEPTYQLFENHLQRCVSCRAYLATYQETIRLARSTCLPERSDEIPEDLVTAILESRRKSGH